MLKQTADLPAAPCALPYGIAREKPWRSARRPEQITRRETHEMIPDAGRSARASIRYTRPERLVRMIRCIEESRPYLNVERALYFTESMQRTRGMSLPLRWARATVHILEHIHIEILPEDLIVGKFAAGRYGIFYPELEGMLLEADKDFAPERFFVSANDLELVKQRILPFWKGKTYQEAFYARLPDDLKNLLYIDGVPSHPAFIVQESATVRHSLQWVPDYDKAIRRGFGGIAAEAAERLAAAEDGEQRDFYTAVIELCQGIRAFAARFSRLAASLAGNEGDEERRAELLAIAERCRRIPWEPAASFVDAVQAQWFVQLVSRLEAECGGSISNGRMDQYLYPLYRKDIDAGILTRQKAREHLDELWCNIAQVVRLKPSPTGTKIYEDNAHWEFTTIGGQLRDGGDATNELSFLILRSAAEFPLDYPYLGVRVHKNMPDDFLGEICSVTRQNGASPVLLNDETIIVRQRNNGATPEEALDYCGSGFSEVRLINRDTYLPGSCWLNLPAVLEMALTDGYCSANPAHRAGVRTGGAEKLRDFAGFMRAFDRQLGHLLDKAFQIQSLLEALHPDHIAFPLHSCLHDLCMASGADLGRGAIPGGRSIGGYVGIIGFATVVDSLAAVNTLVYREKRLSLRQLAQAVAENFDGHEDLRQLCLNCPKYGERVAWVDDIGRHIDRALLERAHAETNRYGGRAEIFYVPVTAYIAMGRVSGASPDGRFAGEKFSFGVTPSRMLSRYGPTVALASEAATHNPELQSLGARVMLSSLLPGQICGNVGRETLMQVIRTWCEHDHWFVQFRILTASEVTTLQNSPAAYADLSANVPGINAQGYAFPSAAFACKCPMQGAGSPGRD